MKLPAGIAKWLRPLRGGEEGASTVEYMLLIALVGVPSLVVFRMLLSLLTEYYRMVVFIETLPMP